MPLTTEMFVLILYMVGFPLCISLVRSEKLPGAIYFGLAYFCLLLSNVFTVLEEWFLENMFNHLEHGFITFGSLFILLGVKKLTGQRTRGLDPSTD